MNFSNARTGIRVANKMSSMLHAELLSKVQLTSANMIFMMGVSHTKFPPDAHDPNAFRAPRAAHASSRGCSAARSGSTFTIKLHMLMLMDLYIIHLMAQYNLKGVSPLTRARSRSSTHAA